MNVQLGTIWLLLTILFVLVRSFVNWERPDLNPGNWSRGCRIIFLVLYVIGFLGYVILSKH